MNIKVKIIDQVGLHARPASFIVQEANKYNSDITIYSNNKSANLKSIMSVMALNIKNGQDIVISAIGPDAQDALDSIKKAMKINNLI